MKTLCVFYNMKKRVITVEIEIVKLSNKILITCPNKLDFYYTPVVHQHGIFLEMISFPFELYHDNNKVLLPFYFNKLDFNLQKEDFILDIIHKYCVKNNLELVLNNIKLENKLNEQYQEINKKINNNRFENVEDIINCYKNVCILFNYLCKKRILKSKTSFFYCGHEFNEISDFEDKKYNSMGYIYTKNYYLKIHETEDKFYPKNPSNDYLFYYLKMKDFTNELIDLILEENLVNNLRNLLLNINESGLFFKFILFIASNNFKIQKSDKGIYLNVLQIVNELKETKLILRLQDIEIEQIKNLCDFLNKYPIFIKDFLTKIVKQVEYSLSYYKRNLDPNFLKFSLIYFGLFNNINFNLTSLFNYRIKNQLSFLINEISYLLKNNKVKFVNNDKFYTDPNYRLVLKYFIFDNNCNFREMVLEIFKNKLDLLDSFLNQLKKFHFYRNIFNRITWNEIITNYLLIQYLIKDRDIILYQGKLNNIIFGRKNFKSIPQILNFKFYLISFFNSKKQIEDYLFYNINSISEIFNHLQLTLSSFQIKQIANILYLLKFVDNLDLKEQNYLNFIIACQKVKDLIINDNVFNLKIKEMGFSVKLNLGIITKNIIKFKNDRKLDDPLALLRKYKIGYYHYRKKYTKYKTKYYLEKFKGNNLYSLKNLKN